MTRNQMLEERNYLNDRRVRNAEWYANRDVNEEKMVILIALTDDEGDEIEHELPARYEVCPTCEGKGKHVNPGVDASGYFPGESDYDEDYTRGVYDVTCSTCHGKRVVLEVDEARCPRDLLTAWREHCSDLASEAAIYLSERMYGC